MSRSWVQFGILDCAHCHACKLQHDVGMMTCSCSCEVLRCRLPSLTQGRRDRHRRLVLPRRSHQLAAALRRHAVHMAHASDSQAAPTQVSSAVNM